MGLQGSSGASVGGVPDDGFGEAREFLLNSLVSVSEREVFDLIERLFTPKGAGPSRDSCSLPRGGGEPRRLDFACIYTVSTQHTSEFSISVTGSVTQPSVGISALPSVDDIERDARFTSCAVGVGAGLTPGVVGVPASFTGNAAGYAARARQPLSDPRLLPAVLGAECVELHEGIPTRMADPIAFGQTLSPPISMAFGRIAVPRSVWASEMYDGAASCALSLVSVGAGAPLFPVRATVAVANNTDAWLPVCFGIQNVADEIADVMRHLWMLAGSSTSKRPLSGGSSSQLASSVRGRSSVGVHSNDTFGWNSSSGWTHTCAAVGEMFPLLSWDVSALVLPPRSSTAVGVVYRPSATPVLANMQRQSSNMQRRSSTRGVGEDGLTAASVPSLLGESPRSGRGNNWSPPVPVARALAPPFLLPFLSGTPVDRAPQSSLFEAAVGTVCLPVGVIDLPDDAEVLARYATHIAACTPSRAPYRGTTAASGARQRPGAAGGVDFGALPAAGGGAERVGRGGEGPELTAIVAPSSMGVVAKSIASIAGSLFAYYPAEWARDGCGKGAHGSVGAVATCGWNADQLDRYSH